VSFADITAGKWDSQFLAGMSALNNLSTPTYFIFEHEADATSAKASCTSTTDSVCGPQFVSAWKHVYDLAHAHGLTKLIFTWTVTEYGFNPQTGVRNNYYWPGVSYTDWIGIDAYNGGCNGSWYGSFSDTMAYGTSWVQAHAPNMPIMLPELGATEGSTANAKADFFNAIPAAVQQPGYTNIRAILYWNDQQPTCDFRVTTSQQSFDAYRSVGLMSTMAAKPAF
jgi:beta-mannanase